MKKRLVVATIAAIVVIGFLSLIYLHSTRKSDTIKTTGIVEGTEVNISSKVSGRISELSVDEGDAVKQGQVLVRLENEDLKASVALALAGIEKAKRQIVVSESMVESAKANVLGAEADIRTVNADAEKARYRMELAKAEKGRSSKLHQEGLISNDAYDVAVTNYNAASADYASASSKLDSAKSKKAAAAAQLQTAENQRESAKADLKQADATLTYNRARLDDTVIMSPISGTVVFKSLEQGETVAPGVTILTIVDMNSLYVRADIEETYIDNVMLGGKATVATGGNPGETFEGRISEIGRYAEFATQKDVTRGRQDIRTFRIKIKVDNDAGILKPGMTVGVEMHRKAAAS